MGTDDDVQLPRLVFREMGKGPEGPVCCGYWTFVPSMITERCAASMLFLLAQRVELVFFP